MSSSTARLVAACARRSATKNGLPFQAGSLNRRSFGSSPGGTVSASVSHWVSVLGGTCASATARFSPTLNDVHRVARGLADDSHQRVPQLRYVVGIGQGS